MLAASAACSPQAPAQNAPVEQNVPEPAAGGVGGSPQTDLRQVALTIRTAKGSHLFTVQVAATPQQQEQGLMFTRSLPADEGMIFPYEPAQNVAFWMKNTLIPLDMVFIRADGTIARIVTAQPLDLTPVPSGEPVVAVLEIAGGRAAQLGIREGDHVEWPR